MNTINKDDPRLTAYVLDEKSDPQFYEREFIEAEINKDPDLQNEVEQLRAFSNDLEQALQADLATQLPQTPTLTDSQRKIIQQTANQEKTSPAVKKPWRGVVGWASLTTAAAATIAFVISPVLFPKNDRPHLTQIAQINDDGRSRDVADSNKKDSLRSAQPLPGTTAPSPGPIPVVNVPVKRVDIAKIEDKETEKFRELNNSLIVTTIDAPLESSTPNTAAKSSPSNQPVVASSAPPIIQADPLVTTIHIQEAEVDKGREEDVANTETGSTGAFMAIGAGGGSSVSAKKYRDEIDVIPQQRIVEPANGETYMQRDTNGFFSSTQVPLSTFGLDVDTASYANVRRMISHNQIPPKDAVRIEEMINYFPYDIPKPQDNKAFSITAEVSTCPWQPAHHLARIVVRGKSLATEKRPPLNLVFLVDVSGSMSPQDRLPLIKTGLTLLANTLTEEDNISIVTYAGSASVALPATNGKEQAAIMKAIDGLSSGGSTNGGDGIYMAYDTAQKHFNSEGVNRVILCTDGDFNVGVTNRDDLVKLAEEKAKNKIFLTVLGVGQGNLKDATMEQIADKANGHYHYLDTIAEARKVLIEQISGTLITIAKDVKAQIEFNPARVSGYRQVGYEKRQMAAQDFNNDKKDAGEMGADHQVTILYELVPVGVTPQVDNLRYQAPLPTPPPVTTKGEHDNELLAVKIRYKEPHADVSQLVQGVVTNEQVCKNPSVDQQFVSAVAAFGLRLRQDPNMNLSWSDIAGMVAESLGTDPQGYRKEFKELIQKVSSLRGDNN